MTDSTGAPDTGELGEAAQDAVQKGRDAVADAVEAAKTAAGGAVEDVQATAGEVYETLKKGGSQIADAVTTTASKLGETAEREYRRNPARVIAIVTIAVAGLVFLARVIARRG